MDFAYDSPSRQRTAPSKLWLEAAGERSLQSMEIEIDENTAKGEGSRRSERAIEQPLSPTVSGPDVDMDTSSTNLDSQAERRSATSTTLTRTPRQRSAVRSKAIKASGRRSRAALKADVSLDDEEDDLTIDDADDSIAWQDEAEGEDEQDALGPARSKSRTRRRSLRKRVGDTLNIQYFFNNGSERREAARYKEHHFAPPNRPSAGWTDPEWCLGMAQFGFNATLLIGVTYVLFNVVLTLQRDVSSKVREYELGE
jgi:hypothetical protein